MMLRRRWRKDGYAKKKDESDKSGKEASKKTDAGRKQGRKKEKEEKKKSAKRNTKKKQVLTKPPMPTGKSKELFDGANG